MFKKVCLFSGNANPALAIAISQYLETPLGKCKVTRFSDGESFVEIGENVRGVDAFVIQPTSSPTNDNVMELLIMVDALRRASAGSITAVIPYYGYGRQDRKVAPRTPITSKLVADLIQTSRRQPRRLGRSARRADPGVLQHPLRSPLRDAGLPRGLPEEAVRLVAGLRLARRGRRRAHARVLEAPDAASRSSTSAASAPTSARCEPHRRGQGQGLHHHRRHHRHRRARSAAPRGRSRTRARAASSPARRTASSRGRRSSASPSRRSTEVVVTDSIPLSDAAKACPKIKQLSIARLLGEAIKRIHSSDSVSSLFA